MKRRSPALVSACRPVFAINPPAPRYQLVFWLFIQLLHTPRLPPVPALDLPVKMLAPTTNTALVLCDRECTCALCLSGRGY
ncbi:hypothetical protein DL89DRAFT_268020 [Linderina pennispora]|uniref:Uncharacterized protein n=1 Tax=Linderina pennispora TaxID=61395 RepID=A0A1Y1W619_9FUNG|nr:uncharacterized protein DL89DRAFT_268020 [Linderina pennispora]ORX68977.1 hypothetical protein DL89DRAFT_268020 [Linderina pennispora]